MSAQKRLKSSAAGAPPQTANCFWRREQLHCRGREAEKEHSTAPSPSLFCPRVWWQFINDSEKRRPSYHLHLVCLYVCKLIIICPIAIAYIMGQIIKSVCVCLQALSRSHFLKSIFTKIGTDVRTQNIAAPLPIFFPQTSILGQEVLKTHANMK